MGKRGTVLMANDGAWIGLRGGDDPAKAAWDVACAPYEALARQEARIAASWAKGEPWSLDPEIELLVEEMACFQEDAEKIRDKAAAQSGALGARVALAVLSVSAGARHATAYGLGARSPSDLAAALQAREPLWRVADARSAGARRGSSERAPAGNAKAKEGSRAWWGAAGARVEASPASGGSGDMARVSVRFELPTRVASAAAERIARRLNAPMAPFAGYLCEARPAPPDAVGDELGRAQSTVVISFCPAWVLAALVAKRLASHADFAAGARFAGARGFPDWAAEPDAASVCGEPIAFGRPRRAAELLLGLPVRGAPGELKDVRWMFARSKASESPAPLSLTPIGAAWEDPEGSPETRWDHSSTGTWSPAPELSLADAAAIESNVALNIAATWAGVKELAGESRAMLLGVGGALSAQKVADRLSEALQEGVFGSRDTTGLQGTIAELARGALNEGAAKPLVSAPRKSRL